MFGRVFRVLVLLLVAAPAWAEKPLAPEQIPGARRVSAEEAVESILSTPGLVVIDARREEEFAKGHIEGAVSLLNTRLDPERLATHVATKDTPMLVYCNGERCARSTDFVNKALAWGYTRIYWFRGGWREWLAKGLPVAWD
jgi:rhodanese-related sulfurtransferase